MSASHAAPTACLRVTVSTPDRCMSHSSTGTRTCCWIRVIFSGVAPRRGDGRRGSSAQPARPARQVGACCRGGRQSRRDRPTLQGWRGPTCSEPPMSARSGWRPPGARRSALEKCLSLAAESRFPARHPRAAPSRPSRTVHPQTAPIRHQRRPRQGHKEPAPVRGHRPVPGAPGWHARGSPPPPARAPVPTRRLPWSVFAGPHPPCTEWSLREPGAVQGILCARRVTDRAFGAGSYRSAWTSGGVAGLAASVASRWAVGHRTLVAHPAFSKRRMIPAEESICPRPTPCRAEAG